MEIAGVHNGVPVCFWRSLPAGIARFIEVRKMMKSNLFCWRFSTLLLTTTLILTTYGSGETSAKTEGLTRPPINPSGLTDNTFTEAAVIAAQTPAAKQNTVRPGIIEGHYAMGGTGQGLEVRGKQYRYYDEGGEHEWRPTSQLTAIRPGHVFDGKNYWCHRDTVPKGGGICTTNGWQAYSSIGTLSRRELFLGGVKAGASAAKVVEHLGQPDQIDQDSPFSRRFTYRGLSVSFFEDAALTIRSVSPDYCTPSGLCPGDAVFKAERLYGAALVEPRSGADYWQYINSEVACRMELEVTNETVGAIAILCQI